MKILGYDYAVTRDSDQDSMGAMGRLQANQQLIQVAGDLCEQQAVSTLIHKILEAVNFHLGLGMSENGISSLESSLFAFLVDNGVDLSPLKKFL